MIDDIADYIGGCDTKNIMIAVIIAIVIGAALYFYFNKKSQSESIVSKPIYTTEFLTPIPRWKYLKQENYIPASGGNFNPDKGSFGARETFTMNNGRDVNSADLFMQVYSNLAPQKF